MNERFILNRKKEIAEGVKFGKEIRRIVAPGELLALIGNTDPVCYDRGVEMLCRQIGLPSEDLFEYQLDENLNEDSLYAARDTYLMDSTREELNRYKYLHGLIPDDEIIAFAMFLVADADIILNGLEDGEIAIDDVSDLVNHVSGRIKFLLTCIQTGRYDVLNTVIQHVKRNMLGKVETLLLNPQVAADDGGVVEFYEAWTDIGAYNEFHERECAERRAAYEEDDLEGDEEGCEDDYYDDKEYSNDDEEPLVERDFEG